MEKIDKEGEIFEKYGRIIAETHGMFQIRRQEGILKAFIYILATYIYTHIYMYCIILSNDNNF